MKGNFPTAKCFVAREDRRAFDTEADQIVRGDRFDFTEILVGKSQRIAFFSAGGLRFQFDSEDVGPTLAEVVRESHPIFFSGLISARTESPEIFGSPEDKGNGKAAHPLILCGRNRFCGCEISETDRQSLKMGQKNLFLFFR